MNIEKLVIPASFNDVESKVLVDLLKEIHNRHKKFGDDIAFAFEPFKNLDNGCCKFKLLSGLRPFRQFSIDADSFEEAIGKMYVIIEEQLP